MTEQERRLRTRLLHLCKIPSPTFNERLVADYLVQELNELGLDVVEDDAGTALGGNTGNLSAELRGDRPERIVLNAHMDTVALVPDVPLSPIAEGAVVHSGGRQILGADDKAGVAIVLELLDRFRTRPPSGRPTVVAVFTVAEERGLLGTKHLDVPALRADFAYVFDGEVPVGQVIARAPYKEHLTITVKGRRAHAALEPEKGVHALLAAAKVVATFPLGRLGGERITNLGVIRGGSATNVIPGEVVIEGEIRAFSEAAVQNLQREIRAQANQAIEGLGAEVALTFERLYDGYDIPFMARAFTPLVEPAAHLGIRLEKVTSIGGSDANVFNQKGLQTVNIGVGMHDIHSVDEWISVGDLARIVDWLAEAI